MPVDLLRPLLVQLNDSIYRTSILVSSVTIILSSYKIFFTTTSTPISRNAGAGITIVTSLKIY